MTDREGEGKGEEQKKREQQLSIQQQETMKRNCYKNCKEGALSQNRL
jgi:hypothetical protein